jgi:hypothetical protein
VDGPGGIAGQGFVSTPDRVFFKLSGSNIVRRQCWGDPDPSQAAWPDALTNAVPASPGLTAGAGVTANDCTDDEVVARNVNGLTFTYFDATGTLLTLADPVAGPPDKDDVFRIDYAIDFFTIVDGRPLTHRVQGSVRLSNLLP